MAHLTDSTLASDQDLVVQLQQGKLESLDILYDRYRHMVFYTALAITGDPEAAADLLQDVFLRLHRYADRIKTECSLKPWLYRVAANLSCTWIRRRHRWLDVLQVMAGRLKHEIEYHETPQQRVERNEEWNEVRQALLTISPEKRVVVVMYYLNDLSVAEIAEVLELPKGTVKSRLHYGRQALKKALGLETGHIPEVEYGTP
jgi:RNA polymerase sigma-70 factor (ECF subfamily)